ncbi:ABC transporter permease [Nocardioides sp. GCM10027113]|uniref:ABC transporter permease n=1 Tax=unclassified Nocardioides TaxID=2615069 RepID=UPI00360EE553
MSGSTTTTGPAAAAPDIPPLRPASHNNGLLEVFRRRYLLKLLVRSTVQARYQGTFLGWFWSYLQPATRFAMFYFVFQVLIERGGPQLYPFAIHLVCGMVLVHFFTETFNGGTRSLVTNRGLIVKLPMPRELFPVATMLVAFWHTIPMIVITLLVSLILGWTPTWAGVGAALLSLAIVGVLGLALALLFSVANVFFRDFSKVTQTLTQFTTFSVPMIYPFSMVEERFDKLPWVTDVYLLNPIAEAVLLMQRCFWVPLTSDPERALAEDIPADLWDRGLIMLGISIVALGLAQIWFSRLERRVPERL